ncbi:MAG: hypothetical protein ACXVW5_21050 [Solirubrobacteraceae bacterium]
MPAPGNGGARDQGPHKQVLLAFAHCLRAHGVNGFPDPNANGQLTTEMISAAESTSTHRASSTPPRRAWR